MKRAIGGNGELISEAVKVIKRHVPNARIIVFGSRAVGNYGPNSDLDLAIDIGKPISADLMEILREELDNLPTLVTFDVVDLNAVSEEFKREILSGGRIVYDGSAE